MIADLKPYTDTKHSGSPWLGTVPLHWEVRKLRTLIRSRNERNRIDLPLLTVARERGVFVRSLTDSSENHNVIPEDLSNYKVARQGNLVINKMKAWQGSMGIAPVDGIVRPAYFVYDLAIANRAFGQALLRSRPYVSHFGQASDGVRVGQWDLTIAGMREIPVLVPPPDEQAAIVRFMDWANGRLDRAIRSKRKVIALLNEQKQAIVHRAVTRGLDPTVPLKTSGIDWTPEIPEGWNQYPLRRLALCENSGSYGHEPSIELRELPVATTAQIDRDGRFDVGKMPRRGFTAAEVARFCCKPGDILVVKSSGSAANVISGKCGIVGPDTPLFIYSNFLARFVANSSLIRPRYLFLLLSSYITRERVKRMVSTTTYPNLRMGEYRGALLPVPPVEEQERILESVGAGIASIDQALGSLDREITLLREYRTRLVADVVTGKLDVREAAAGLPKEEPVADDALSEPYDQDDAEDSLEGESSPSEEE